MSANLGSRTLEDVERLNRHKPVDIVVFTGDLSFSGSHDQLELAQEMLLDPLERDFGIERRQIVLCPGNHDVNRALIEKYAELGLREELTTNEAVNHLLDHPSQLEKATHRLSEWDRFVAGYYSDSTPPSDVAPLARVTTLRIQGTSIGIAALNSAWRSSGDKDKETLLVGDRQVHNALKAIANAEIRCVAMHHPLEWLAPFDADMARRSLARQGVILLSGHLHEPSPESLVSARGSIIFSRAGCLYQTREDFNSYSVLDIRAGEAKVETLVRTWWPSRHEFDEATNLAHGGRVSLPLPPTGRPLSRAVPDYTVVRYSLGAAVREQSVIADSLPESDSVTVDNLLIAPRFWPIPHREVVFSARSADSAPVDELDALHVLEKTGALIVAGDPEAGVTSALYWLLDRHYASSEGYFPVRVQFDAKFDKKNGERLIRDALMASGMPVPKGAALPPCVCAIDDVQTRDPRAVARLAQFILDRPEHRFILGTRTDAQHGLSAVLYERHVQFGRAFLGPFGSRDQRAMIEKIVGPDSLAIAPRVTRLLRGEGLPRSPFHLAVLIAVVAVEENPSLVNESTILLAYVERLLGRGELRDADGLGADYRLREHALGALASYIYSLSRSRLSRLETEGFFSKYFDDRGLTSYSPGNLVNALIRRRILVDDETGVAFRHQAVFYLFVAKWAHEDPAFEAVVLSDPLPHGNVVHHAAALRRSDRSMLAAVTESAATAIKQVSDQVRISHFDAIRSSAGWSNRPSLEQLKLLLATPPPNPEDIERQLDAADDRKEAGVPSAVGFVLPAALDRMARAVQLLSDVLASSELVDDVALKERALRLALEGWGLVEVIVSVVEDQARFLHTLFSDAFASLENASDWLLMLDDMITTWIALLIAFVSAGSLNTAHLRSVLSTLLRDTTFMRSTAHALFSTILSSHLKTRDWPDQIEELYRRHHRHPIAREFAVNWALILYREGNGSTSDLKKIEEFFADVYTGGRTYRGRDAVVKRARARDDVIRHLRESAAVPTVVEISPAGDAINESQAS